MMLVNATIRIAHAQRIPPCVTMTFIGCWARSRGIEIAPRIAPMPKLAERRPKPPAPRPSWSRAITGSSAQNALAHTLNVRLRSTNARMGAEWRTKRSPIIMPEMRRSGTPGSGASRRRIRFIATNIGTKKNAAATSVAPDDNAAASAPAAAGPMARATLKATEPSAIARGSSLRGTSSLMLACCAGR